MKTLITAIVIALTATVAQANQEAYDNYVDINDKAWFCHGYAQQLTIQSGSVDKLIEAVGEAKTEKVITISDDNQTLGTLNMLRALYDEDLISRIQKKKFENHYFESLFTVTELGYDMAQKDTRKLGLEATVNKLIRKCTVAK